MTIDIPTISIINRIEGEEERARTILVIAEKISIIDDLV
jgi:hypothetical protein